VMNVCLQARFVCVVCIIRVRLLCTYVWQMNFVVRKMIWCTSQHLFLYVYKCEREFYLIRITAAYFCKYVAPNLTSLRECIAGWCNRCSPTFRRTWQFSSSTFLLVACFLLTAQWTHVDPEDHGRMFLRNVGASCRIVSRQNSWIENAC
jgi:hypothetical protein